MYTFNARPSSIFCKKISGKRKFSHKAQFSLKLTDLFVLTEQSNTGCQLRVVALTVLHPDVSHIPLDLWDVLFQGKRDIFLPLNPGGLLHCIYCLWRCHNVTHICKIDSVTKCHHNYWDAIQEKYGHPDNIIVTWLPGLSWQLSIFCFL